MPLVRYFLFVGGVLLALLFVCDWVLPQLPAADVADAGSDKPFIRINSERKWPERVVFDTSVPTITPVQIAKTDTAKTDTANTEVAAPAPVTVADVSAARFRDAFAQFEPPEQKKPVSKPPPKRKIAKKRVAPTMVVVAQQPRFGLFGNPIW
jgi:hypothetical protein